MLTNMLEKFGMVLNNPAIKVSNVAAVMVTADLSTFERSGSRIDVTVSSIGDASSLQGGVLLQTPLIGPDGNTYALATGSLILGGFSGGSSTSSVTVNHPTVGRIPNGASVEREIILQDLSRISVETMELVLDRRRISQTPSASPMPTMPGVWLRDCFASQWTVDRSI